MSLLDTPGGIAAVASIYAAALDAQRWPETVAAVTAWIGGEIGALQLRRFGAEPSVSLVCSGAQPGFEAAYVEHYHRLDPHLSRVAQLPQGRTVLSREVLRDEELFASEFYNDFFRPQGVCDLQGAMLIRDPSRVVTFATQSSLRERYDNQTRSRLDALVPHLTRAVQVVLRTEELEAAQQALGMASQAGHSGLLRVSQALVILEGPSPTLDWLGRHGGALFARDGKLHARDAADAEQLRACVRSALGGAPARCLLTGAAQELVSILVSPAPPSLLHPEPGAFIAFSVQPREPGERRLLAGSIAALPPALRRVGEALELGLSDKEIADRLQLPLATARTYVARTLRRLGVNSRRELMVRGG